MAFPSLNRENGCPIEKWGAAKIGSRIVAAMRVFRAASDGYRVRRRGYSLTVLVPHVTIGWHAGRGLEEKLPDALAADCEQVEEQAGFLVE